MYVHNTLMTEKKVLLQGKISEKLKRSIDDSIEHHRFNITQLVEAMAELWVSLPSDMQVDLYNRKKSSVSIEDIIDNIVEMKLREFMAGIQTGQNAAESEKAAQEHKGKKRTQSESA